MSQPDAALVAWCRVAADHPALPGHFPGRPIVPGVLLLDAVLQAMRRDARRPRRRGCCAPSSWRPWRRATEVTITLAPRGAGSGRFAFTCRVTETWWLLRGVRMRRRQHPCPAP